MKPVIRILMVDDDEEDFLITRDAISEIDHKKYTLDWVSTYEEALEKFALKEHDIYFVDYRLGIHNGLELIEKARETGVEAPLVLLTGQNDQTIDEMALKAGAADYLVKGTITPEQLDRVIRYSISQSHYVKEIVTLNAQLEQRVKERTQTLEKALGELELSKAELSIALEKERELNDLKSRFVAMASHEFRTPLATILSSLSLIVKYIENGTPENAAKHLLRIRTSVTNMTDLLNDVLSLSKLEEGQMAATFELLDIKQFTGEIVQDLHGVLKPGQEIVYNHTGEKKEISVDKKILKNVLLNLISNAIKFSPEGKNILLSIDVAPAETIIRVSDQGIGISEEDQKHLFQRFFRGQNATNIQGTGLGLSIVVKYIEMLGGTIGFESALGKGTTFTVTLPSGN